MIVEYHRPKNLEETLALLARPGLPIYPLGGGTYLSRHSKDTCAVVDLQNLELDHIEKQGSALVLGATATLQSICESPDVAPELKAVVLKESSVNLRRKATLAGILATADESSPLATALLALDAHLTWLPGEQSLSYGDWLPVRSQASNGKLIIRVSIPLQAKLLYEGVSRTPKDRPIVCAAVGSWPSGRTRVVIGGFGDIPLLVMDGPDKNGAEDSVEIARSQYIKPENNKDYQIATTKTLVHRLLK